MLTITRFTAFWCWFFLLGLARPAGAASPGPAAFEGTWRGALAEPGGQAEIVLKLAQLASGDVVGVLDLASTPAAHQYVTTQVWGDSVWVSAAAGSRFWARLSADGQQLQGRWQQAGEPVPLTLTRQLVVGPTNAPPPPYRQEAVSFGTDQVRLAGTLTVPPGAGPFPAVVLLTDRGALDRNELLHHFAPLALLADYLTRHGLVVLRFDTRGTGQSTGSAPATLAERVADARTALNFLRTRFEVNLAQLGLVGHGEGSSVALVAASQPLPPAFVVGLAPYGLSGADITLHQQQAALAGLGLTADQIAVGLKWQQMAQAALQRTPNNTQAQTILVTLLKQRDERLDDRRAQRQAAVMVAPPYRDFLAFNPASALLKVRCPVLLLGASADQSLRPEANLQALDKALSNNSSLTIRKLPGVNHQLQPDPTQWPIVSGQPRPVLAPALEAALQEWLATQQLVK